MSKIIEEILEKIEMHDKIVILEARIKELENKLSAKESLDKE